MDKHQKYFEGNKIDNRGQGDCIRVIFVFPVADPG